MPFALALRASLLDTSFVPNTARMISTMGLYNRMVIRVTLVTTSNDANCCYEENR